MDDLPLWLQTKIPKKNSAQAWDEEECRLLVGR